MHTGICCVKLNVAAVRQVAIDFGGFNGNFNAPGTGWPPREIYKMQLNSLSARRQLMDYYDEITLSQRKIPTVLVGVGGKHLPMSAPVFLPLLREDAPFPSCLSCTFRFLSILNFIPTFENGMVRIFLVKHKGTFC